MSFLISSLRLVSATMIVCVAGYTAAILAVAQLAPQTARGSLVRDAAGTVIGSRLIAQQFRGPRYFWPRPSAAGREGYDAMGASGSNESPTSREVAERAREIVARYGATPEEPLPAELAAASGGGLDPHISVRAALYQASRVADARDLPPSQVEALVRRHEFSPGGFMTSERLVNVLELNLSLDAAAGGRP